MAATFGSMNLRLPSGRTITVDCSIPDAVATLITFNATGLSATTSPATYIVPQDAVITDFSLTTAPTATGAIIKINSGIVNGGAMRYSNRLATLSKRMDLAIPVKAGDQLSMLQF